MMRATHLPRDGVFIGLSAVGHLVCLSHTRVLRLACGTVNPVAIGFGSLDGVN